MQDMKTIFAQNFTQLLSKKYQQKSQGYYFLCSPCVQLRCCRFYALTSSMAVCRRCELVRCDVNVVTSPGARSTSRDVTEVTWCLSAVCRCFRNLDNDTPAAITIVKVKQSNVNLYSAVCHVEDCTLKSAQISHVCNKGIIQCFMPLTHKPYPAAKRHRPLAGTHCAYPRRDGQAELTWVAGYISR